MEGRAADTTPGFHRVISLRPFSVWPKAWRFISRPSPRGIFINTRMPSCTSHSEHFICIFQLSGRTRPVKRRTIWKGVAPDNHPVRRSLPPKRATTTTTRKKTGRRSTQRASLPTCDILAHADEPSGSGLFRSHVCISRTPPLLLLLLLPTSSRWPSLSFSHRRTQGMVSLPGIPAEHPPAAAAFRASRNKPCGCEDGRLDVGARGAAGQREVLLGGLVEQRAGSADNNEPVT